MSEPNVSTILVVSDGTGETASLMVKAAMVQFPNVIAEYTRFQNIRNEAQIDIVLEEAAATRDLIVFTIVSPQLRGYFLKNAKKSSIPTLDLLGPILGALETYFTHAPKFEAGILHDVNETYFKRIEAMEFTIAHDDGRDLRGLEEADLVILGISRTSKTPLSMYLSHQGWRVCNIPIIQGFDIPKEVYNVNQKRVVCLTIDSEVLVTIRQARLQRLGQEQGGEYAEMDRVQAEVEYANEIFRKNRKWSVFNVTGKALEETASEIIRLMTSRRLQPGARPKSQRKSKPKVDL